MSDEIEDAVVPHEGRPSWLCQNKTEHRARGKLEGDTCEHPFCEPGAPARKQHLIHHVRVDSMLTTQGRVALQDDLDKLATRGWTLVGFHADHNGFLLALTRDVP